MKLGSVKEKKEGNTSNVDSHKWYFFLVTLSPSQAALRSQESVLCYLILTLLGKLSFRHGNYGLYTIKLPPI